MTLTTEQIGQIFDPDTLAEYLEGRICDAEGCTNKPLTGLRYCSACIAGPDEKAHSSAIYAKMRLAELQRAARPQLTPEQLFARIEDLKADLIKNGVDINAIIGRISLDKQEAKNAVNS